MQPRITQVASGNANGYKMKSNKKFRVGIDNYSLFPLNLSPMETLVWAKDFGAEGVAFSGLQSEFYDNIDNVVLLDLKQFAAENNLYLEWGGAQHIPRDMVSWQKKDISKINQKSAVEAQKLGTRIVRSCSGGLMRWNPENPATEILLHETANALKSQRQMLMDHNVILAIETHFEFTTFELLKIFEYCETEPGEYLGICLDTMNLLTMLENPVFATERILPWIVSTHIKDGGLLFTSEGLKSFVTEIGCGAVEIEKILRRLFSLDREVHLSIEDHGGDFNIPIFNPTFLSRFPDLNTNELASLTRIAYLSQKKVEKGKCEVLDRKKWLKICEDRVKKDIGNLKKMVAP